MEANTSEDRGAVNKRSFALTIFWSLPNACARKKTENQSVSSQVARMTAYDVETRALHLIEDSKFEYRSIDISYMCSEGLILGILIKRPQLFLLPSDETGLKLCCRAPVLARGTDTLMFSCGVSSVKS